MKDVKEGSEVVSTLLRNDKAAFDIFFFVLGIRISHRCFSRRRMGFKQNKKC